MSGVENKYKFLFAGALRAETKTPTNAARIRQSPDWAPVLSIE